MITLYATLLTVLINMAPAMPTSDHGKLHIIKFEGFSSAPYRDAHGCSVGYGHWLHAGSCTAQDRHVTKAEAWDMFSKDILSREAHLRKLVKVPLSQNEFDALMSFVYNVGTGAFMRSTLLRKLNAGDKIGAADEFLRWTKNPGIKNRREATRKMFLNES
ncbi:MAG: lysozyme [Phaeodactylibacter sp.]|nr:lysozyme [Phaeodactylibacter sp.]